LRLVDKHIDFGFVRERLKDSYSDTGRPSIDPELLLRVLLIGYLYGISSERKFVEELLFAFQIMWHTSVLIIWRTDCGSGCEKVWGWYIPRKYEAEGASPD
jgi:hypothetical protein